MRTGFGLADLEPPGGSRPPTMKLRRPSRLRFYAISLLVSLVIPASGALAASRLVVVPIVVGGGGEPDTALMSALAEGLKQNPQWSVEQGGDTLSTLAKFRAESPSPAEVGQLEPEVAEAARKLPGDATAAATQLDRVRNELRAAAKKGPLGTRGDDLGYRTGALLVAAHLAAKQPDKAKQTAAETVLAYPGRSPNDQEKVSPAAKELLRAPPGSMGAKLTLVTRPEGCQVSVHGVAVGKAPVELQVLQEEAYYAEARCDAAAATATTAAAPASASIPKRIVIPGNETTRQEVLDAEFERGFAAEGLRRLRFSSPQERRSLEESYARRLSERFDADVVVLASVGELSGADWLNARLYLRSGYLNRQGLVRLEANRANALGRYLATGKDVPGVLKPEEAGALVAASRSMPDQTEPTVDPWYTDIPGWSFLGVGLLSFGLGRYGDSIADDRQSQADSTRGDSEKQMTLYRDAQSARFWSGVATIGGLLLASTGVVLLLVPEYNQTTSELFGLAPAPMAGGGGLVLGGRF
jgi:hypothetical protein